ncbi:MAG: hypothetical protein L6V88_01695 [Anaerotruncus sp.]|nr:MAG: hypothetical protein L6V88_01695 [Anaerotruncus sp.]
MLSRPKYDENGKKVLCEMGGVNSEMNMDIYVKKSLLRAKCLIFARIKKRMRRFIAFGQGAF